MLEEDDNLSFSSPAVVYNGPDSSTDITDRSPGTRYCQVKACDAARCSNWSNVESVEVWPIPAAPTLDDIGNEEPCDGDYTVSWSSVADATSYELQADEDPAFSSPTTVYQGSDTSVSVANKDPGTYTCRVRASNASCNSAWSDT